MQRYLVRAVWLAIIGSLVSFGLTFTAQPPVLLDRGDVVERPWIDHFPRTERDPFRGIIFGDAGDGRQEQPGLIVFIESRYKQTNELFFHSIDAQQIRFTFPHDNTTATSAYKVEKMPSDADDLDLKLTIERNPRFQNQRTVYYSSTTWRGKAQPDFAKKLMAAEPWTP